MASIYHQPTAGAFSLETGWGSGGVPGFFGGFGRTNPTDLTGSQYFNFWINPNADQDYTLEINLQDDDTGDDAADAAVDDEFQFNCTVSPAGPCAVAGGGWQLVSVPLADFFDDNSFFTGGNGVLDAVPTSAGGNGQLVNVVFAVIGNSGSDVNFRTDYWTFSDEVPGADPVQLIDDFENGLPSGVDGNGIPIGFNTFSDGSPVSIATTNTPPAPVPGSSAGNNVIALTSNVGSFAGFTHGFENAAADTWVPQDWSSFEGIRFWLYGQNTGIVLFLDLLDNRNPGSTTDDAERFVFNITDDFSGWQYFEIPFGNFVRKEIGNGAPNDGLTLTQVHGWALGMLNTGGNEYTYYMDQVEVYGVAEIPPLAVTFSTADTDIEEGTTGNVAVKLNRAMNSDDPDQVSIDFTTEAGSATPNRDYAPTSGTLTFVNGGPSEVTFPIETFDDSKWEGSETIILRLSNPVDVEPGFAMQAFAAILDNDPYDPFLLDDFEKGAFQWDSSEDVTLSNPELARRVMHSHVRDRTRSSPSFRSTDRSQSTSPSRAMCARRATESFKCGSNRQTRSTPPPSTTRQCDSVTQPRFTRAGARPSGTRPATTSCSTSGPRTSGSTAASRSRSTDRRSTDSRSPRAGRTP